MTNEERFHDISLIVDNCAGLLARVLLHYRLSGAEGVERYLRTLAASDHYNLDRSHAEGRQVLRRALSGCPAPVMAELVKWYKMKHDEGNRLTEFLSDELRALETSPEGYVINCPKCRAETRFASESAYLEAVPDSIPYCPKCGAPIPPDNIRRG